MADATMVSRIYGNFRGVDFRGEDISLDRSPDAVNVWKDYKETNSIRTRPAAKLLEPFDGAVYGVFFYTAGMQEQELVHSGDKLYRIADGSRTELYAGLREARSESFVYNNLFYLKDGAHYLCYDGITVQEVSGYVPTTSIGRAPSGGGTVNEDVNLLTGRRINMFVADGTSTEFYLDAQNLDSFAPIVKVNGVLVSDYTVSYPEGKITFSVAPVQPLTEGQDNVSVEFSKTIPGYRERISGCKLLTVFDNRVFFSGNQDYPNMIFHSSLNNPEYCSDLDYYNEGLDYAAVKGLVAGNNALWVFKEPSQAGTTVFYHTPTIDSEYGKIYPSVHSSISTGCIGGAINFNDDIVFFSERGMEGIHGDVTAEQVIAHRSTLVDRRLTKDPGYQSMILVEWEGYLVVLIGNRAYLADSRAMLENENHMEYEWFYWETSRHVTCAKVHNGMLYIGTPDGVYAFFDLEGSVESHWVTPKDKFQYPQRLKTSNKRGCVAEGTGDVSVYAKTEQSDFELIGTEEGITDYFVSRIKRKKFKDIQLMFRSSTRFSLETVTLECFIGGYIKR